MTIPSVELELVLVRHGQTKWNVEHRYLGHTDLPLHPDAVEQLSELKQWLDRLPKLSGVYWRVFCSDLMRCRETLAYISPTLEKRTVYDQRLREMNFGAWEGCTYDELKNNSQYRSWIDDPTRVTPPEGETWAQFEERVHSFLSDLGQAAEAAFGQDTVQTPTNLALKRVLIVTHGGVIRKLLAQIVPGVTFYSAVAPSPGTAMILKLRWRDGQWSADILET